MVDRALTNSIQSSHSTLPESEEHNFTSLEPTLLNQAILHNAIQQLRALLETRVGIQPAIGRVKDDVITPVKPSEIEQVLRPLDRDTCRLGQFHLLREIGEGGMSVA